MEDLTVQIVAFSILGIMLTIGARLYFFIKKRTDKIELNWTEESQINKEKSTRIGKTIAYVLLFLLLAILTLGFSIGMVSTLTK